MQVELVASQLRIARGPRVVIDGLSLSVPSRHALVLTGPNGAGKTTLLRALGGLIAPESGAIALIGGDGELTVGEQSHLVSHRDAVKAALTVIENARFWAQYLGGGVERILPALERLGLDALSDVPAGYLSAGQRRRLGLARLLLADRRLWLLDEPTVSLDAASVETLGGIVRDHLAAGGMVVAATHVPLPLGQNAATNELRLGHPAGVA